MDFSLKMSHVVPHETVILRQSVHGDTHDALIIGEWFMCGRRKKFLVGCWRMRVRIRS